MAPHTDCPPPDRESCATAIRHHLATARTLRQTVVLDPAAQAARCALRAWQAGRLSQTHADLLNSPRCGNAARFFLTDLYGPKDFSERDNEVERILPLLCTLLPPSGLEAIALAIEVDALTERLDAALINALKDQTLDARTYAFAYRTSSLRAERERQLDLIGRTGRTLRRVAGTPFIGALLRMMRGPAHAAGLGELQAFLERGLAAFRAMGPEAEQFLATIKHRESALIERIYRGDTDPFTAPFAATFAEPFA